MAPVRVTLRDIANHVGVHPSTVSRVLNHGEQGNISTDVIKRVKDTARQLGYRPNWAAYQLRTNRSHTVAVIVNDITNHMNLSIVRGIEDRLMEAGLTPMICNSEQRPERISRITSMMRSGVFDGMVVSTAEPNDPIISACQQEHLPCVTVGRNTAPPDISAVIVDEIHGTQLLLDHLASLGHRRVALISGGQRLTAGRLRHHWFLEALAANGMIVDPSDIIFADNYDAEDGRRCCETLLQKPVEFTAIVAVNDLVAMGCYQALSNHHLHCPRDVSVTGYNEVSYSALISPPLTTVRARSHGAGVTLAEMLIDLIEYPDAVHKHVTIVPELVVRDSTGPART
jgi:LacI family transcriptional regulator